MHVFRRKSQAPTSILILPVELLEHILKESCNTTRTALRSTCSLLCSLATPFVFETLVIDIAKTHLSNFQDRLSFFAALVSGKTFARYVKHLRLVNMKVPVKNRTGPLDRIFFKKRREQHSKKLEELLVAAVPFLTSLQTVLYDGPSLSGLVFLQNGALWDQISYLPGMSTVSAHEWVAGHPFSNSNFPHITELNITDPFCFNPVAVLVSRSPNLSSFNICSRSSKSPLSIDPLFYKSPKGTYSSITALLLCGDFALRRNRVHLLIPHLRQLQSLELSIKFLTPAFWASLQAERIFLRRLSLSLSTDEPALFDYLCSYSGLRSFFLGIRTGFGEDAKKGMERVRERHGEMLDQQMCEPPGIRFGFNDQDHHQR
ncbi:uncharacterized protein ARMOST_18486 [Armillaria ostoyae]|uniref:F-box domain-containing protein n=1 Tax=Armillaria ostoyae TaxID=47428 RepID=A0A284S1X4_ARMOS|nr:uncharacterized protein ARMOST_18486 [Armillaria ostoyae]